MKIILLITTFFFYLSAIGNTCEIQAPTNILLIQKNINNGDIVKLFKANFCQEDQLTYLRKKVLSEESFFLTEDELRGKKISILNSFHHTNIITLSSCKDVDSSKNWTADEKIIVIKGNHFDCNSNKNELSINTEMENLKIELTEAKKFPYYKAVLKIDMMSGELSPDFFKLEFSDSPVLDAISDINTVASFKLTRSILLGEILTHKHLKIKKSIMPGRIVNLTASINGIELESSALALESGGIGETIKVQNLKSKKIFMAEIQTSNSVRIEL